MEACMDLTQQFLAWVDDRPRTRADVMDAWRSSCPRLTIWEDAVIAGLVRMEGRSVLLTAAGRRVLNGDGSGKLADAAPVRRSVAAA
jgi:hypothetical protein